MTTFRETMFRTFNDAYAYLASRDFSFVGGIFKRDVESLVVVKSSSGYWLVKSL